MRPIAVESAHEQHVASTHGFDTPVGDIQAARPGKDEQAMLDTCMVPAVVVAAELGDPESALVLHHRLGARSSH